MFMNMITDNYAQSITDFDKREYHRRQRQDTISTAAKPARLYRRLRQKYKVQRTSFNV
jgi:hypothetical protein